ncbi:hypothetical protein [Ciceribacter azotifigens]|uniref:hypothetical protein n=1 Tax=Ciceribacter azotifigens TaxID=2069303 RepID=UPI003A870C5A
MSLIEPPSSTNKANKFEHEAKELIVNTVATALIRSLAGAAAFAIEPIPGSVTGGGYVSVH